MLTGLLRMPSTWFVDLYEVWTDLIEEGFLPKINISHGTIKWGINIHKTYDF